MFLTIVGTVLARKIVKKGIEKRGPVLNDIVGPLEAFGDSFRVEFGVIFECFGTFFVTFFEENVKRTSM